MDINLEKSISQQTATHGEVADYICHFLEKINTRYVFGIPGGSLEPFYSALARSQKRGGITPIISRHESGAAFMADGYARETGKLGVCCATSGPGATNMITGVASAYKDNSPLLVITAQSSLHTFGKGAVQESSCTGISTTGMYAFCTRYNSFISHPSQIYYKLHAAVHAAIAGPSKGPAHLSIPLDILRTHIDFNNINENSNDYEVNPKVLDQQATSQLITKLKSSKKIVLLLGIGASGATGQILETAAKLNAKIVSTPDAKGIINAYHPLYYGVFGFAGHDQAYECINSPDVDYVLAIGTKLDEHATNGWDTNTLLTNNLIHIDDDPEHFQLSPMANLHVYGNIAEIFHQVSQQLDTPTTQQTLQKNTDKANLTSPSKQLNKHNPSLALISKSHRSHLSLVKDKRINNQDDQLAYQHRNFSLINEEKCFSDATPLKPQRLMYELSRLMPPSTRFVADIGNSFLWAIHYLQPKDRRIAGRRAYSSGMLRMGMGFASMGWAVGAAIGTAIGSKDSPVVAFVGDGSYLMSGQELTVASELKLPVIFVILNDAAFGTVKHGQRMTKAEPIGYQLPNVDFKALANAMGVNGFTIKTADDLLALDINAICQQTGPTLLDVYIDPNEVPPLTSRLKVLGWDKEKAITQ